MNTKKNRSHSNREGNISGQFWWLTICFALILAMVLISCAPSTLTPTPTPLPTAVPSATKVPPIAPPEPTPEPTKVPPTATPAPGATPTKPAAIPALPASDPTTTTVVSSAQCLACHGPFEKIVAGSVSHLTDRGDKINPHTTVDETQLKVHKSAKGMIECANCHKPHPPTATSAKDVPEPNMDMCYIQCHHRGNFTPCASCHKDDSYATWLNTK